jgi:hypothetical protein
MEVQLTSDQEAFIRQAIKTGRYAHHPHTRTSAGGEITILDLAREALPPASI